MSPAFRLRSLPAACAAGFALLALPAVARPQAGPDLLEHEILVNPVDLAAHPKVQQELGIDDATKQKILEIAEKEREQTGEVMRDRSLVYDNRRFALTQIRARGEKQLYELLDEKQKQRIEQLRLQQDGYISLARPELEKEFELDMTQGPKVRQAAREIFRMKQRMLIDIRFDRSDFDLDDIPRLIARIKKEFDQKLDKSLTAEQKAKWKKLVGEPLPLVLEPLHYTPDSLEKVKQLVASGEAVLLDVREQDEWDEGHVEGAVSITYSDLTSKDEEKHTRTLRKLLLTVPRDKTVYCYSNDGRRALVAVNLIREFSYDARALKPGYLELIKAGFAPSK
jgi:phage shock protein E